MSTAANYPHVFIASDGIARVGDTRYKVEHLAAEHYHYGWTAEELLRQHPNLRPEQVYAALAYFYDHYDEIVASITTTARQTDIARSHQTLSRADLLSRQQG